MTIYKIKSSSWPLFIISLLLVMGLVIFASLYFFPVDKNPVLIILTIIVAGILGVLATRFSAIALLEITITETQLIINKTRNFLFLPTGKLTITWNEIDSYKFESDRNFDLLKIERKQGKPIRLWHDNSFTRDDFYLLRAAFEKQVQQFNKINILQPRQNGQADSETLIKIKPAIYETGGGLLMAFLAVLMLVAILLIILLPGKLSATSWFGLTAAAGGAIFFIRKVWEQRRRF